MALLNWRVVAAIVLAVALASGMWKSYVMGKKTVQAEWTASIALANETARETERLNRKSKEKAIETRTKEILANVAAADRVRVAADGLRDTSRSSVQTARESQPACVVSATAHAELFGECRSALTELAGKAQGHATDVKTLIEAWPK